MITKKNKNERNVSNPNIWHRVKEKVPTPEKLEENGRENIAAQGLPGPLPDVKFLFFDPTRCDSGMYLFSRALDLFLSHCQCYVLLIGIKMQV